MAAYVLVNIDVTDPERYKDYARAAPETVARYGGRYIARGGRAEALEGPIPARRVVVIEFETYEQAKAWWASEEYRDPKGVRQRCSTSSMLLVEGV